MSAPRGSAAWRERVSRGTKASLASKRKRAELERERLRVRPRDLVLWEESGQVAESARPALVIAADEALALTRGLGGEHELSEQQKLLVSDYARLGAHLALLNSLIFQKPDGAADLISRSSTVIGQRTKIIALLGIARFEKSLDPTKPIEVEFDSGDNSSAAYSFGGLERRLPSPGAAGASAAAAPPTIGAAAPRANALDPEDAL